MTDPNPDAVWYCTLCAFCGTASEADAHLVTKPRHVLSPLRTKTGRIVTNAEMDEWVRQAERGYEVVS